MTRIGKRFAILAMVIAAVGALLLVFRETLGFADLVAGTISGFVFALTGVIIHMGYDQWKTQREEERRRQGVFKGIYLELLELLEYMGDLYKDDAEQELLYLPPLPRVAWDRAYTSGYMHPDDKFCQDLRHIYEAANNFTYLMNQAIDVRVKSTLQGEEQRKLSSGLIRLMRDMRTSLVPLVREAEEELGRRLNISSEEVARLQMELRQRIRTLRLPDSARHGGG